MSGSLLLTAQQWFDNDGQPLSGGKIFTYIAGTSTLKSTYTDAALTAANTNPVILDAAGRASIFGAGSYKIIIKDQNDVLVLTQDNIALSGAGASVDGDFFVSGNATVAGNTTVGGSLLGVDGSVNLGNADVIGSFSVDSTPITATYPVKFTHTNVFTNASPYGSGTVLIEALAQNNNQPNFISANSRNSSTLGNGCLALFWNKGGAGLDASSDFAADVEFVANNSFYSTYNGKYEIAVQCGRNTGNTDLRDGYLYIGPRRGPLNPSGANTGFEKGFIFKPLTTLGQGELELQGNKLTVAPIYDFGFNTTIDATSAFQNSIITATASLTGKSARIQVDGMADSYFIATSREGTSSIYVRSNTDTAYLQLQSNVVSGTASAILDFNTGTNFWRFSHAQAAANFSLIFNDGTNKTSIDISSASDGLVSFLTLSATKNGKIRLGNSSGTAGGGQITYTGDSGLYALTGTNARLTVNSLVVPRQLTAAPVNTAAAGQAGDYFVNSTFLYFYVAGTGWVRTAVATF